MITTVSVNTLTESPMIRHLCVPSDPKQQPFTVWSLKFDPDVISDTMAATRKDPASLDQSLSKRENYAYLESNHIDPASATSIKRGYTCCDFDDSYSQEEQQYMESYLAACQTGDKRDFLERIPGNVNNRSG